MINLENRGQVATMRMVRGKGNALDVEFLGTVLDKLDELESGSAGAVIITGQGNVFGAGVDLPALVAGGADYVREFVPLMQAVFERLATFPKPLIAAVNGHAIAGGAIFMFACDQRLLARGNARIGLTEVLVGVRFPSWALEIARFATPPQHFPTLVTTGRTWLPEDALARGLVDELVDPDDLLDRAHQVAQELASIPSATFAAAKMATRLPMFETARTQALLTDQAVLKHWSSPETLSLIDAFAKKTIKSVASNTQT